MIMEMLTITTIIAITIRSVRRTNKIRNLIVIRRQYKKNNNNDDEQ